MLKKETIKSCKSGKKVKEINITVYVRYDLKLPGCNLVVDR